MLPVDVLTDGGEAWVHGNIVDRGGRAAVGDEHHDAGHQSTGRGRHLHRGALGGLGVGLIGQGWSRGGEFGRSPSGGVVLVAGTLVLPRS